MESTFGGRSLQQLRWPPTNIAETPDEARDRIQCTGPDGHLYAVSTNRGTIYEIFPAERATGGRLPGGAGRRCTQRVAVPGLYKPLLLPGLPATAFTAAVS
jgi:hypothetical protein